MNIDLSKVKVGQICKAGSGDVFVFGGLSGNSTYPFLVGDRTYTKDGVFDKSDPDDTDFNIVAILPFEPEPEPESTPMRFETNCAASIAEVQAIFTKRGAEYADTWGKAKWVTMIAAAKSIGITLTNEQARLLVAASLCDVKYWRNLGGLKKDNVLDGIAYGLNFLAEMEGGAK